MTQSTDPKAPFQPFTFAQVTDLHLAEDRGPARLARAAQLIGDRHDIDFVLLTGDLLWRGPMIECQSLIGELGLPVHALYGNRDGDRLAECEAAFGPRDNTFRHNNCLFVMSWNCLPFEPHENHRGDWTEDQWLWLAEQLEVGRSDGCQHLFFASHVPPAHPQGYFPAFFMRDKAEQRLAELLSRFNVTAAFFGHLHQDGQYDLGGSPIIVTPSANWNFIAGQDGKPQRVEGGFFRIITVHHDHIEHELIPIKLPGE